MKLTPVQQNSIKQMVAKKAATFVEDGMLVGLGTGSTAAFFIESLIEKAREGLNITAVSSSTHSEALAKAGGIPVIDINQVSSLDLTIDGADEVDLQNRLIKGGGGAHVREKIVASMSQKMIVIVDESKLVSILGNFGLPVEILSFGNKSTIAKLNHLGYSGKLREKEGSIYISDNGNYIYDIHLPTRFTQPEEAHDKIVNIPGVVETGFFFNLPVKVLVGYVNGNIKFREPS